MYGGKTVSVVLPAYNEEKYIRAAVDDFFASGMVDEVVVVDNNSRDRTVAEAQQTRARIVSEQAQGYGNALRRGLREALARIQDDLTVGGSHFLPQMVIAGLKRGLRIIEVPVNYRGRVGDSKITGTLEGTLRTGLRMIALIIGSRFR